AGRDVVSYFGQVGVAVVVVQVSLGVKAKPLAALDCGAIYEAACTWGVAVATVGGKGGYQHVGAETVEMQCGAQRKLAVPPSYAISMHRYGGLAAEEEAGWAGHGAAELIYFSRDRYQHFSYLASFALYVRRDDIRVQKHFAG